MLPMDEVRRLSALEGAEIREAKQALAFEATRICHGAEAASEARVGAEAAFGGGTARDAIPTTRISRERLAGGVRAVELFVETGLCKSNGEATKLFRGGGGRVGERRLTDHRATVGSEDFTDGEAILQAGRKRRHRLVIDD